MFLQAPLPNAEFGMRNAELEGEVVRPSDAHLYIPHSAFRTQVTKIVTISCGPATNLTRCPRPSRTSARDSRSSARTRCALLTPSPNRQAPATFRLGALQHRSTTGEPA